MRHFIHRASFVGGVVCVLMIPIWFVVEATKWGSMPEGLLAYFSGAWMFAIINHVTRKLPTD